MDMEYIFRHRDFGLIMTQKYRRRNFRFSIAHCSLTKLVSSKMLRVKNEGKAGSWYENSEDY